MYSFKRFPIYVDKKNQKHITTLIFCYVKNSLHSKFYIISINLAIVSNKKKILKLKFKLNDINLPFSLTYPKFIKKRRKKNKKLNDRILCFHRF